MEWTLVVPLKAMPAAKSRLAATLGDSGVHERLVPAIRHDTIAAAAAATLVRRVVVVADADGPALAELRFAGVDQVIVQADPGLNQGLTEAAEYARTHWPDTGVAALVGDLPALRSVDLDAALSSAAGFASAYVADADGTGTTLLTAAPGTPFTPKFGAGSASRHARTAHPMAAAPGLRQDVDTEADLRAAVELGVGPQTRAAVSTVISCSP